MAYITLGQYETIMKVLRPVFLIFLVLFFGKEFSLLFEWGFLLVDSIPDVVFLIVFSIYAFFYITPMFKPEWVDGFELPDFEEEEEEENQLSEEEKELKELERISL